MNENKFFLGVEIDKQPHKIARELVAYMLKDNRPKTLDLLVNKLSETNTLSNLKSRVRRCLTNTPDKVNENKSKQSRIFSIPLQYKNIEVDQVDDAFSLKLTGISPEIREEDYTQEDLEKYIQQKGMNKINVKQEFANWLLKNAPETYSYYLGSTTNTIIERLNEISAFFPNQNFFEVDTSNLEEFIRKIKFTFSTKERRKNEDFIEYDKQNSNGIPKAVMGKNNYVTFLREKFGNTSKFTWIKTYTEIVEYIKDKKEDQTGLIKHLKDAGCDLFNDQNPKDTLIPLKVIDPFTFFCYLNKYFKQRLEILQKLATNLNFTIPADDFGLPSTNPQKVWVFPYKYLRNNNEIDRLWSFFESVLNDDIKEEQFQDILQIRGVANTKLTEILFYTNPVKYFPINGPTKPYLENVFNINPKFKTFKEYKNILKQLQSKTSIPFYELSYEAWIWNNNIEKETSFFNIKTKFDKATFNNYVKQLRYIIENFNLSKSDKRVVFSIRNNRLNFIIGQRYAFNLYLNEDKGNYGVISIDKLKENSKPFQGGDNGVLYTYFKDFSPNEKDWNSILQAMSLEFKRTTKSGYNKHNNIDFQNYIFDMETEKDNTNSFKTLLSMNQILYGPPGTGKTYRTIAESIKIIDQKFFETNKNNRKALTDKFKELLITDWKEAKGQIAFCTFHQSFTYEDFVEGIKPITQNKNIHYDIEPGIFKRICDLADSSKSTTKVKKEDAVNWSEDAFRKAYFYKLSLGEANNPDDIEIYEFCRDNNYIAIGFAGAHDLTGKSESEIKRLCIDNNEQTSAGSQLSTFIHGLSIGDYVLISKGNYFVRALGKVVGEYEYHDEFPLAYNHVRRVEWLFTDENIPIEELYHTTLMQRSIYRIDHDKLKKDFFVKDGSQVIIPEKEIKPYVIVIDEINRGNVASIFGELITLIETDKRADGDEEMQVILPYSKQKFSVPDNVYIIGTMNTADRSIEALDSALRRRFSFDEVMPRPKVIKEVLKDRENWNGISLSKVLETVNKRISALIDRDHQIGHSYFLKLKDANTTNFSIILKGVFSDNIIPLLQEYFFNDYVKIGMILGNGFINIKEAEDKLFAEMEDSMEDDYNDVKHYKFVDLSTISDAEFKIILNKLLNK